MSGHEQVPLMQREGYVYREHKHVLARRILPGDIVLEKRHGREEERWTVESIEATTWLTYVTFVNGRRTNIGSNTDRVWVSRIPN
jgi:hypothetical protein